MLWSATSPEPFWMLSRDSASKHYSATWVEVHQQGAVGRSSRPRRHNKQPIVFKGPINPISRCTTAKEAGEEAEYKQIPRRGPQEACLGSCYALFGAPLLNSGNSARAQGQINEGWRAAANKHIALCRELPANMQPWLDINTSHRRLEKAKKESKRIYNTRLPVATSLLPKALHT
jgi:hypothetical protein